ASDRAETSGAHTTMRLRPPALQLLRDEAKPSGPPDLRLAEIRVTHVARESDAIELDIDGHPVRITSPGKVLFSEHNETKLDLVNYYLAMAEPVMRAMGGRPVLMERYPHGAEGNSFFQKRVPDNAPDWLTTEIISTPNGTTSNALVIDDLAHVAWAVNLG